MKSGEIPAQNSKLIYSKSIYIIYSIADITKELIPSLQINTKINGPLYFIWCHKQSRKQSLEDKNLDPRKRDRRLFLLVGAVLAVVDAIGGHLNPDVATQVEHPQEIDHH